VGFFVTLFGTYVLLNYLTALVCNSYAASQGALLNLEKDKHKCATEALLLDQVVFDVDPSSHIDIAQNHHQNPGEAWESVNSAVDDAAPAPFNGKGTHADGGNQLTSKDARMPVAALGKGVIDMSAVN